MQHRPWEQGEATHQGDLQDIERLVIENLLSFKRSRQHGVNTLQIPTYKYLRC
jgi:hypothetical protein